MRKKIDEIKNINPLADKVSTLISSAQGYVDKAINTGMLSLYWNIGKSIQEDVIKHEKPEYGERIIQSLANELSIKHGKDTATEHFIECYVSMSHSRTTQF